MKRPDDTPVGKCPRCKGYFDLDADGYIPPHSFIDIFGSLDIIDCLKKRRKPLRGSVTTLGEQRAEAKAKREARKAKRLAKRTN